MHKSLHEFKSCPYPTTDYGSTELAALKRSGVFLLVNYSKYYDDFNCWLSGERPLPFWFLVTLSDLLQNLTFLYKITHYIAGLTLSLIDNTVYKIKWGKDLQFCYFPFRFVEVVLVLRNRDVRSTRLRKKFWRKSSGSNIRWKL